MLPLRLAASVSFAENVTTALNRFAFALFLTLLEICVKFAAVALSIM